MEIEISKLRRSSWTRFVARIWPKYTLITSDGSKIYVRNDSSTKVVAFYNSYDREQVRKEWDEAKQLIWLPRK